MKIKVLDPSTYDWREIHECSWVRVETASGTFDIQERGNTTPPGFTSVRLPFDSSLEVRPVASNGIAIRSSAAQPPEK